MPDGVCSNSKRDLTLEGYKLTALLGKREGWRTTGGRVVEPQMTDLSLAGNKGAHQGHRPCPSPSQKPKGNWFLPGNLLALHKHPTLGIHPSGGFDSLQVPQGPSLTRSLKEKRADPAPPTPVHPANPPQLIRQILSTTSLAVCK